MIAQAAGGTISVTGEPDRPPVKPGPSFGDTGTGMLMTATILAALLERGRTGQGRRLQVAMQDAMIHYMRTCFRHPGAHREAGAAPRREIQRRQQFTLGALSVQTSRLQRLGLHHTSRGNPSTGGRLMRLIGRGAESMTRASPPGAARVQHEAEVDAIVTSGRASTPRKRR